MLPIARTEAAPDLYPYSCMQSHLGKCINIIVANTPQTIIVRIPPMITARCAMPRTYQR